MMAYKNMFQTAISLLVGVLVVFVITSYVYGFQSDSLSRSLIVGAQIIAQVLFLVILVRKSNSINHAHVLRSGLFFSFAMAFLKLLFILTFTYLEILPIVEMLFQGYARALVDQVDAFNTVDSAIPIVKKDLSPTFLLIFVVLGSFIIGASVSFLFYLAIKTKSKWIYH